MPDGEVLWRGTASARWPIYFGAGFIVLAVILALATRIYALFAIAIAGPPIWALASITVEITGSTLKIRYLGGRTWPVARIRLADIREASVVDLRHPGSWGYRGSLRIYGKAALILRSGPSLQLQLARKRVFLVTVDDPEGAVQVLQRLTAAT